MEHVLFSGWDKKMIDYKVNDWLKNIGEITILSHEVDTKINKSNGIAITISILYQKKD